MKCRCDSDLFRKIFVKSMNYDATTDRRLPP
jgi:hypothetical protein